MHTAAATSSRRRAPRRPECARCRPDSCHQPSGVAVRLVKTHPAVRSNPSNRVPFGIGQVPGVGSTHHTALKQIATFLPACQTVVYRAEQPLTSGAELNACVRCHRSVQPYMVPDRTGWPRAARGRLAPLRSNPGQAASRHARQGVGARTDKSRSMATICPPIAANYWHN
jgi:hypothetical protein